MIRHESVCENVNDKQEQWTETTLNRYNNHSFLRQSADTLNISEQRSLKFQSAQNNVIKTKVNRQMDTYIGHD